MKWQSASAFLRWMRDFYFPAIGDPMAVRIDEFLGQTCKWGDILNLHDRGGEPIYDTGCGRLVTYDSSEYTYCPYCGFPIRKNV